jgi:hypothetical protein
LLGHGGDSACVEKITWHGQPRNFISADLGPSLEMKCQVAYPVPLQAALALTSKKSMAKINKANSTNKKLSL